MAYYYEFREYPTGFVTSMTYFLLTSNMIGTMFRAYSSGNNWLLAFIFYIYLSFLSFNYCYREYHRLPSYTNSSRKNSLGVAIWCLYTGITFGFCHQFASHFDLVLAVLTYAAALASSAAMFYAYIIDDDGIDQCSDKFCDDYYSSCWDSKFKFAGGNVEIIFEKV